MHKLGLVQVFHNPVDQELGNIAAIIIHQGEIDQAQMQGIARDLAQPATTFLRPTRPGHYQARWFAPDEEIGLCGHGSIAAGVYLAQEFGEESAILDFKGGRIKVGYENERYFLWMNPIDIIDHCPPPEGLEEALGQEVHDYFTTSNKDIVVLKSEESVREMKPNFKALVKLPPFGYTVTAPSDRVDFVSRTLVPKVQQLEDHATGSSHAILTPFWAERLMKNKMKAKQLSPRGASMDCEIHLNQVRLWGEGKLLASGKWLVDGLV